jgi:hypothetical protein
MQYIADHDCGFATQGRQCGKRRGEQEINLAEQGLHLRPEHFPAMRGICILNGRHSSGGIDVGTREGRHFGMICQAGPLVKGGSLRKKDDPVHFQNVFRCRQTYTHNFASPRNTSL